MSKPDIKGESLYLEVAGFPSLRQGTAPVIAEWKKTSYLILHEHEKMKTSSQVLNVAINLTFTTNNFLGKMWQLT